MGTQATNKNEIDSTFLVCIAGAGDVAGVDGRLGA
jgi:hypothetical protein